MNDEEDTPLGMEVNECGFHVSRIIGCLAQSKHAQAEKATIDLVALAREHARVKKELAETKKMVAQLMLVTSHRDELQNELDDEKHINQSLIDELVMAKKNPVTPGKLDLLITKDKGALSWRKCTKRPVTIEFRDAVPGEVITTIDGTRITMTADHLVMRGTRGELYPITKAIFHETYVITLANDARHTRRELE